MNFDASSYEFGDLDLEMAVNRLPKRDQNILILYLMGHKQRDIGKIYNVSRSMISKRMQSIMGKLARQLLWALIYSEEVQFKYKLQHDSALHGTEAREGYKNGQF